MQAFYNNKQLTTFAQNKGLNKILLKKLKMK